MTGQPIASVGYGTSFAYIDFQVGTAQHPSPNSRGLHSVRDRRQGRPLPPLPEQRAIAHILGTLDDKIELNRRMNETLEEMARALFKSWFVDFDPVRAKAALKQHALRHRAAPDGNRAGTVLCRCRRVDRRTRPRLPGRHGPADRRPLPRPAGGLGAWGDSRGVGGEGVYDPRVGRLDTERFTAGAHTASIRRLNQSVLEAIVLGLCETCILHCQDSSKGSDLRYRSQSLKSRYAQPSPRALSSSPTYTR